MIKHVTSIVAIVAALFASGAMPAAAQEQPRQQTSGTYYWLHPRLGMVKVDRATNAMVRVQDPATLATQGRSEATQTKYWLDPKGNVRVLRIPTPPMQPDAKVKDSSTK